MMRFALVVAIGASTTLAVGAAPSAASGLRLPDAPETTATLRTGSSGHRWRGDVEIAFHNGGSVPLDEIWLRLWPNGIAGCAGSLPIRASGMEGGVAGDLEVDCTALPVTLDAPVPQDGTGEIRFRIAIDLPHRNDRFGWANGLAFLGSALPALAISDADGTHLDPYSDLGESFYSQVGRYSVTLDVPQGLATPATGTLSSAVAADGRVVRTYTAGDVRDFAWAAGRLRQRTTSDRDGVLVRVWHPRGRGEDGRIALNAAVRAMNEYRRSFGPYGYPEVDVVTAEYVTFGGMEYPTLVFANPSPAVVAHELAHQWWYGVVGNDEYREPWLDEAFASWSERLVDDRDAASGCRQRPWLSDSARISNGMGYWDAHPGEYNPVVYAQGACALSALAARFGLGRFLDVLAHYVAAHRLGFSTTAGFTSAIESAAATLPTAWDPTAFWDRWRIGPP
jgi:hypothetical protein